MEIQSFGELQRKMKGVDNTFLLLYKSGSEQSDCAKASLLASDAGASDAQVLLADVGAVRDIHTEYGVTTVPSLLSFHRSELKNIYKGCQDERFFKSVIEKEVFETKSKKDAKPQKRVVVYSTPSCVWCKRIKDYLRANGVRFREVDVSKDQAAAEAMVAKSGQRGVPQTEIGGRIIVGFDKVKIDQLLDIK